MGATTHYRGFGLVPTVGPWITVHAQNLPETGAYRGRGWVGSAVTRKEAKELVDACHEGRGCDDPEAELRKSQDHYHATGDWVRPTYIKSPRR